MISYDESEAMLVAMVMVGLRGMGVKMVQLDAMMQSPLYSTMLGGQKYPCTHCVGQPSGGVGLAHVGRQTGPHSE